MEESPMGMVMIKESMEKALDDEWGHSEGMDIISATSVGVEKKIKNPRDLLALSVCISDIKLSLFDFSASYQSVEGNVIKIRRVTISNDIRTVEEQQINKNLKGFLLPSPFIQCDDPDIVDTAKNIVGSEKKVLT